MTKSQNIQQILNKELDPAFARRAKFILKSIDPKKDKQILNVGCGRGFYETTISHLYPNVKISGLDNNQVYLNQAQRKLGKNQNVKFFLGSAYKLPFKNNSFNTIICSEVLEHLDQDLVGLKEIYRVVKKGGKVLITVPHKHYPFNWDPLNFILEKFFGTHINKNIWWLAGIWADHMRLYDEDELVSKIKKGGLNVEKVNRSTAFCLPFTHFILYGIGKNLVEKKLIGSDFDRFDISSKPSRVLSFVKKIIYSLDHWNELSKKGVEFLSGDNDSSENPSRFMNLLVLARKK